MARRKTRRNAWRGSKRRHAAAARKGWRKRRRRRAPAGGTKRRRAALKGWRRRRTPAARPRARRRRRRNPLWRKKDGEYTGRRTKRRLHRKRRRSGGYFPGWRNNAPKRRRRKRRTARRNPYHYNRRRYSLRKNPLEAIIGGFEDAFSMDTLENVLQTGAGFAAGVGLGGVLSNLIPLDFLKTSEGKVVTTGIATIVVSGVAGGFLGGKWGSRMLVGGMLATLMKALGIILPAEVKEYVPTLGDNESYEFRKAIESEVLRELGGGGMGYLPAAGSEAYTHIPAAGSEAYMTPLEADRAQMGMGAYLTSADAMRAESRGVGMGQYPYETGEIGRTGLVEKF